MRISEIEEKIQQGYFTEELFANFQAALNRVPKNMRLQHCYTTAYYLKDTAPQDGIRMIRYGIDTFESSWINKMRAHRNLGGIYEACKQYPDAKAAFESALNAIPQDNRDGYLPDLFLDILRVELHCSNFTYTEYAYQLYQSILKADGFSFAFRSFVFYRGIMEIILAKKNNDPAAQAAAYNAAMVALNGEKPTDMDLLLNRHNYQNDAHATKEAIAFLTMNKI